jgi:hypothetical protein
MKKIILAAVIACMIPTMALADRDDHHRGGERREHREGRGGGFNPWPFVAGAIVGGIIVNESNRDDRYVERNPPRQRRVLLCEDYVTYDIYNRPLVQRRCRYEWVSVD